MNITRRASRLCGQLGLAALLIAGSIHPAVGREFFRWVDDEGVTHYSAQPPRDRPAVKVHASNTQVEVDDQPDTAASDDQGQADTAAGSEAIAVAQKDPERCAAALKNIKTLTERPRIRIKENGEYRYLTADEVADKLRMAEQVRDEEC